MSNKWFLRTTRSKSSFLQFPFTFSSFFSYFLSILHLFPFLVIISFFSSFFIVVSFTFSIFDFLSFLSFDRLFSSLLLFSIFSFLGLIFPFKPNFLYQRRQKDVSTLTEFADKTLNNDVLIAISEIIFDYS